MKFILIALIALISLTTFAEDIVCQVKLLNAETNEVLSEREIRQSSSGMVSGSIIGAEFYIESYKRRIFRKPIPNSVISFGRVQNGWDNSTIIQFWKKTNLNRYGILTETENIGTEIKLFPGEKVQESLGSEYLANVECSLQESQYYY
jgi:hypothetical protein